MGRGKSAIGAAWTVAIAAAFIAAAVAGTPAPKKVPAETLVVAALAAAIIVGAVAASERVLRAVAAAAGLFAAALVVSSHRILAAAVAAGFAALCLAIGDGALSLGGNPPPGRSERATLAAAIGILVCALAVLGLGLARTLTPATLAVALPALALILQGAARRRRRGALSAGRADARNRDDTGPGPETRFLEAIVVAGALLQFCAALLPETQFDALNYHLAVPRDWLAARGIVALPYWHSYLAHVAEAFFAVPLAFGGAPAAKLAAFAVAMAILAATHAVGTALFGRRAGWWAAAAVASITVTGRLGTTVGADGVLTLLTAAGLLAFARVLRDPAPAAGAIFGALAGGAAATKLNGAFAAAVLVVAFTVLTVRRRIPWRTWFAGAVASGALAIPWFWNTARLTGNPVFPFFNALFQSPLMAPKNEMMNARLFGIGTGVSALFRLPFAATFTTRKFGEGMPNGAIGIVLLLVPLTVLAARRPFDPRRVVAFVMIAVYAIGWAFSFQHARYLTAVLPLAAALAAGGMLALSGRGRTIALLAAAGAIVAQTVLFARLFPAPVKTARDFLAGNIGTREYLRRTTGPFDCIEALNGAAGPSDRVAGLGGSRFRFYIDPPLDAIGEDAALDRALRRQRGAALRDVLWARGDRLLFVNFRDAEKFRLFGDPDFQERFADVLCDHGRIRILRLRAPGVPEAPPAASEKPSP